MQNCECFFISITRSSTISDIHNTHNLLKTKSVTVLWRKSYKYNVSKNRSIYSSSSSSSSKESHTVCAYKLLSKYAWWINEPRSLKTKNFFFHIFSRYFFFVLFLLYIVICLLCDEKSFVFSLILKRFPKFTMFQGWISYEYHINIEEFSLQTDFNIYKYVIH